MRGHPAVSFAALMVAVASAVQAEPPRSFRLGSFAKDLYGPQSQQVLQVIGDSINSTGTPNRMQVGYRDHFAVPFNGWVVHADNGNSDIGYTNAQSSPVGDFVRDPDAPSFCGVAAFAPIRYRDSLWETASPPGTVLVESVIFTPNLNNMKLGNPFGGGRALTGRYIAFNDRCQFAALKVQGVRGSAINGQTTYDSDDTPADEVFFVDCAISANPGLPSVRVLTNATAPTPGGGITTLGARFRADGPSGVQMQFLAHSGWRTLDHLAPERFTDAAIRQFYRATDPPTHVMLWIGQNLGAGEATGFSAGDASMYRENLRAIMDRHNAAIADLGSPAPRWLLISQYKTGYPESYHQLMAQAQYDLAKSDTNVCTLNLYLLAGGENFNHAAYLTDGVHPSALGVAYLSKLMNAAMQAAVACRGDFNGDGFLNGDDFDFFSEMFLAGDPGADFNDDGFANGDDFDQFIDAFLAGC